MGELEILREGPGPGLLSVPFLQAEDVIFLYHPCAHPWLKLQLALLAHACVAQPSLASDSGLTQDRVSDW